MHPEASFKGSTVCSGAESSSLENFRFETVSARTGEIGASLGTIVAALVLLVGTAFADPVTYNLEAATGRNGGTLTGSVTWDDGVITTNADLKLANATEFSFVFTPGSVGTEITRTKLNSPSIFDRSLLSGTFGVTDLIPIVGVITPRSEQNWTLFGPGNTDIIILLGGLSGGFPAQWFTLGTPAGADFFDGITSSSTGGSPPWKLVLDDGSGEDGVDGTSDVVVGNPAVATGTSGTAGTAGDDGIGPSGNGGNGGNGGAGGSATATATEVSSIAVVNATAMATGGNGGAGGAGGASGALGTPGASGAGGIAGDATADASATNTGTGEAIAQATATGGAGDTQGAADATATATTNGGAAVATATADGGSGLTTANAITSGGLVTSLTVQASVPVSSVVSAQARASVGQSVDDPTEGAVHNAFAFATGLPGDADVNAALAGNDSVSLQFDVGGASDVLGYASMGVMHATDATGPLTSTMFVDFDLDMSLIATQRSLVIGFLDPVVSGAGFDSMRFRMRSENVDVLDNMFTSVDDALAFFDDKFFDLGDYTDGLNGLLDLTFTFDVTTSTVGDGFLFDFIFGNTDLGAGAPDPEAPPTPDLTTWQLNSDFEDMDTEQKAGLYFAQFDSIEETEPPIVNEEGQEFQGRLTATIFMALVNEDGTPYTNEAKKAVWLEEIDRIWNDQYRIFDGPNIYEVVIVPVFDTIASLNAQDLPFTKITVHPGTGRADVFNYFEDEPEDVTFAHEFGHILGAFDEYDKPGAVNEVPPIFDLTSIMGSLTGVAKERHYGVLIEYLKTFAQKDHGLNINPVLGLSPNARPAIIGEPIDNEDQSTIESSGPALVPEPTSLMLLALGAAALAGYRRERMP